MRFEVFTVGPRVDSVIDVNASDKHIASISTLKKELCFSETMVLPTSLHGVKNQEEHDQFFSLGPDMSKPILFQ